MPYRNDLEALQEQLSVLERRLATVRARRAAVAAEAQEEPDLMRDLDRLRRQVASRTRLPLLANVAVASPCSASWDAMTGDDRQRHCAQCDKSVFNLSAMTAPEAEALLASASGGLCVRYFRRADGTVMTTDCPVGVRRRRIKLVAGVGAGLAMASAGAAMLAGMVSGGPLSFRGPVQGGVSIRPPEPPMPVVQGGIGPEPQPPMVQTPVPRLEDPGMFQGQAIQGGISPPPRVPGTVRHPTMGHMSPMVRAPHGTTPVQVMGRPAPRTPTRGE